MARFSAPKDAVAAVIKLARDCFIFQKRDVSPNIPFAGMLSLFGGAIEYGETPDKALKRELNEELTYDFSNTAIKFLGTVHFDFKDLGLGKFHRTYFLIEIPDSVLAKFIVREGLGLKELAFEEIISSKEIVPYDFNFMWFYLNRKLF